MRRRHVNILGLLRLGLKAVLPVYDRIKPVEERDDGHLTLRGADGVPFRLMTVVFLVFSTTAMSAPTRVDVAVP